MFNLSRPTRLIALALASCAVTWAFAAGALAMPLPANPDTGGAPAYNPFVADSNKAPVAQAPDYIGVAGDTAKAPDPAQVQDVLNSIGRGKTPGAPVAGGNDDTGTIALILAIAAMLTALGAVTLTVTRTHKPMLRA